MSKNWRRLDKRGIRVRYMCDKCQLRSVCLEKAQNYCCSYVEVRTSGAGQDYVAELSLHCAHIFEDTLTRFATHQ